MPNCPSCRVDKPYSVRSPSGVTYYRCWHCNFEWSVKDKVDKGGTED
jgi:transposase-like protein